MSAFADIHPWLNQPPHRAKLGRNVHLLHLPSGYHCKALHAELANAGAQPVLHFVHHAVRTWLPGSLHHQRCGAGVLHMGMALSAVCKPPSACAAVAHFPSPWTLSSALATLVHMGGGGGSGELTFSGVLGGAGEAQDRTTISYTIDEDTRAKAFDVMFALGESRLEPCCMKPAIKLLGVYGSQCVTRTAQHYVEIFTYSHRRVFLVQEPLPLLSATLFCPRFRCAYTSERHELCRQDVKDLFASALSRQHCREELTLGKWLCVVAGDCGRRCEEDHVR